MKKVLLSLSCAVLLLAVCSDDSSDVESTYSSHYDHPFHTMKLC